MRILAYTIAHGIEWQRAAAASASLLRHFSPNVLVRVYVVGDPIDELKRAAEQYGLIIYPATLSCLGKGMTTVAAYDCTRAEIGRALAQSVDYDYYMYFDADVLCMRKPEWVELEEAMLHNQLMLTPDHPVEGPRRLEHFKNTSVPHIPSDAPVLLAYGSPVFFPRGSFLCTAVLNRVMETLGAGFVHDEFSWMFITGVMNEVVWRNFKVHVLDRKWGEQIPKMLFSPLTIFAHMWWDKGLILPTFRKLIGRDPWML